MPDRNLPAGSWNSKPGSGQDPAHVDGTIHRTCAEANASHEHFDGKTTE
jgi:hypothetical protein